MSGEDKAGRPLFLARQSYRRRRLMDAARLLPVFGGFLLFLPILWAPSETAARSTAFDGIYLFMIWPVLILAAFVLARALAPVSDGSEAGAEDQG